jgi:hypothetical protein
MSERYYNVCPRCRAYAVRYTASPKAIVAPFTASVNDPMPEYREDVECERGHKWTQTRQGPYGVEVERQ